jgi:hypothetical protein
MKTYTKHSFVVLMIAAAVFCGLGVLAWRRGDPAEPLLIDATTKSFGEARPEENLVVPFALVNQSTRPIRVIGASTTCTTSGCLKVEGLPQTIPPGKRHALCVSATPASTGDFTSELTLYTDCPGKPEIVLVVKGRVVQFARGM